MARNSHIGLDNSESGYQPVAPATLAALSGLAENEIPEAIDQRRIPALRNPDGRYLVKRGRWLFDAVSRIGR